MDRRLAPLAALVTSLLWALPAAAEARPWAFPIFADQLCATTTWSPAFGCVGRGRPPERRTVWASSFENPRAFYDFGQNPVSTQLGQPQIDPIGVVDARAAGVPEDAGAHVIRFPMDRADAEAGLVHSKLYKTWNIGKAGSGWPGLDGDVSGRYSADVFWPADRSISCRDNGTSLLMGWKEVARHRTIQDPTWWLQMVPACWVFEYQGAVWVGGKPTDPNTPVVMPRYWNHDRDVNDAARAPLYVMAIPRGRWFTVSADLHDHAYIDWTVDGRSLGRSLDSEYPVGPQYERAPDDQWTFEIGNYGNGHALGTNYFDDVSLTRER